MLSKMRDKKALPRKAARHVLDYLLPPTCVLCGKVISIGSRELCDECFDAWSRQIETKCPLCGKDVMGCSCRSQRREALDTRPIALGFYVDHKDEIGRLVYSFKRGFSRDLTRFFARCLAAAIERTDAISPDTLVTYAPRSAAAKRTYGFDHARMLARRVATELGCEFAATLRRSGGAEQKTLDASSRRRNVSGEFAAIEGRSVAGRDVLLIDDVVTTGATLAECTRVLRAAGASRVQTAVLFASATRNATLATPWFEEDDMTDLDGEFGDIDALEDDVGF